MSETILYIYPGGSRRSAPRTGNFENIMFIPDDEPWMSSSGGLVLKSIILAPGAKLNPDSFPILLTRFRWNGNGIGPCCPVIITGDQDQKNFIESWVSKNPEARTSPVLIL